MIPERVVERVLEEAPRVPPWCTAGRTYEEFTRYSMICRDFWTPPSIDRHVRIVHKRALILNTDVGAVIMFWSPRRMRYRFYLIDPITYRFIREFRKLYYCVTIAVKYCNVKETWRGINIEATACRPLELSPPRIPRGRVFYELLDRHLYRLSRNMQCCILNTIFECYNPRIYGALEAGVVDFAEFMTPEYKCYALHVKCKMGELEIERARNMSEPFSICCKE